MNIVVSRAGDIHVADWGGSPRRCSVGRGGVALKAREGDGVTPIGQWPLRRVLYRADRLKAPACALAVATLERDLGWCETPDDPAYNKPVQLPYRATSESMWREDGLYDVVLVVGFNDDPVVAGLGSAIFVHVARPNYAPTAGCVGLALPDLLEALAQLRPNDRLIVQS
jgi:L,D-peptidoglycan transpeptidase YkuD (ErfK/YbiS/YcfS/YnhG family)